MRSLPGQAALHLARSTSRHSNTLATRSPDDGRHKVRKAWFVRLRPETCCMTYTCERLSTAWNVLHDIHVCNGVLDRILWQGLDAGVQLHDGLEQREEEVRGVPSEHLHTPANTSRRSPLDGPAGALLPVPVQRRSEEQPPASTASLNARLGLRTRLLAAQPGFTPGRGQLTLAAAEALLPEARGWRDMLGRLAALEADAVRLGAAEALQPQPSGHGAALGYGKTPAGVSFRVQLRAWARACFWNPCGAPLASFWDSTRGRR